MKIASIIFICLGVAANFIWTPWWLGLIGIGFGIALIVSLCKNTKLIWLGIIGLFFTSLLGAIFYLCWTPEETL